MNHSVEDYQNFWNACYTGNINQVRFYLEKGLDPNHSNKDNWTAAHYACNAPQVGVDTSILVLIELSHAGASFIQESNQGYLPIDFAVNRVQSAAVLFLLEQGSRIPLDAEMQFMTKHHAWIPLSGKIIDDVAVFKERQNLGASLPKKIQASPSDGLKNPRL